MGAFSPAPGPHRLHRLHRLAAGTTGGFLLVFGAVGAVRSTGFATTSGPVVMGLFTNGLLSTLSLLMGAVLLAAAARSGPVSSTVSVVAGTLFVLSGIVNVLVLDSPMNVLAFRMVNVVFSLLVGTTLLVLGSYGRFTGSLPDDSPYSDARPVTPGAPEADRSDGTLERALADAERAVAQHSATPRQSAGVRAAAAFRGHAKRIEAFAGAIRRSA